MSTSLRYYYVDSQNQAAGPVALSDLQNLRSAGTIQDSTLVVLEGGQDWVAYSTLPTTPLPSAAAAPNYASKPADASSPATTTASSSEPVWAQNLLQKVDQLNKTVEKMAMAIEKSIAVRAPQMSLPATAALHTEKFNPAAAPKMGIAATLGNTPRQPSTPGHPSSSSTLTPLAVPANAVKSPLPLPNLNVKPTPLPTPQPGATPAKPGNLFSKFLKK
jgi:GYF domain 2